MTFTYADYPNMGFHLKFENGYRISVQWGGMNYGSNRHKQYPSNNSTTAEVAIWDSADKPVRMIHKGNRANRIIELSPDGEDTLGWINTDDVVTLMGMVASIKTSGNRLGDAIFA